MIYIGPLICHGCLLNGHIVGRLPPGWQHLVLCSQPHEVLEVWQGGSLAYSLHAEHTDNGMCSAGPWALTFVLRGQGR